MNFGWHRAEVIGATISVLMIWVVTGILVYVAIQRIISGDYEIDATIMLITSGVGVGVNIMYVLIFIQSMKNAYIQRDKYRISFSFIL